MDTSHLAWTTATTLRLSLEWFRLRNGDPSILEFVDDDSREKWESFISTYRQAVQGQHGALPPREDQAANLAFWVNTQAMNLKEWRRCLEN